jgi:hypothetical protein
MNIYMHTKDWSTHSQTYNYSHYYSDGDYSNSLTPLCHSTGIGSTGTGISSKLLGIIINTRLN